MFRWVTELQIRRQKPWRQTWLEWAWVFASMPVTFIVVMCSHAAHVRVALGHWPFGFDDYPVSPTSRALLDIHEFGLVLPAFVMMALSLPLWLTFALAAGRELEGHFKSQAFWWLESVCALMVIAAFTHDSAYLRWFFD